MSDTHEVHIDSALGGQPFVMRELVEFRHLLWMLVVRDVRLRYRQTVIGVLWVVLQPLLTATIFSALFTQLGRAPMMANSSPFLSILTGYLVWQYFAQIVSRAGQSLVNHRDVIVKVFFPRILLLLSPVLNSLVDFVVGLVFLLVLAAILGVAPSAAIVGLPFWLMLAAATGLAIGTLVAATAVHYRDILYALPMLLQLAFFASPVLYETAVIVPERHRWWYQLNPMAVVLEGFRQSLWGLPGPTILATLTAVAIIVAALVVGLTVFRRVEQTLADWL